MFGGILRRAGLLGASTLCLAVAMVQPTTAQVLTPIQQPRLVSVSGDAEVRVAPDEVCLTLGLGTSDKDLAKAKQLNNDRLKGVQDIADKFKIDRKDVKVDYLTIQPSWQSNNTYKVSRRVEVSLRQLDKFDEVLTYMVQNNRANSVQSIQFRTTQLRKYRDQARDLAIKAAREKAVALTEALGAKVGKPYSITEDQSSWWSGYSPYWGGYGRGGSYGGMNSQVMVAAPSGGSSADKLAAPGQISVSASVSVSFEIN
jgi:uncharacterized protein